MDMTEIYKDIDALDTDDVTKSELKEKTFLYKQAVMALNEKRYKDCIGILEMLLERVPEDTAAKSLLAISYSNEGYPVRSIRLWEEI